MPAESLDRDVQFRGLSGEQRELLMIQVAKRYYELDMTMGELAKELGLTRWQAQPPPHRRPRERHRAHRDRAARAAQPRPREPPAAPLRPEGSRRGAASRRRTTTRRSLLDSVAQAAARFIAGLGHVPLIGVSWGRTMSAVAQRLPPLLERGRRGRAPQRRHEHPLALGAHQQHRRAVRPLGQRHRDAPAGAGDPRPCGDARGARAGPDDRERACARTARAGDLLRHGRDRQPIPCSCSPASSR